MGRIGETPILDRQRSLDIAQSYRRRKDASPRRCSMVVENGDHSGPRSGDRIGGRAYRSPRDHAPCEMTDRHSAVFSPISLPPASGSLSGSVSIVSAGWTEPKESFTASSGLTSTIPAMCRAANQFQAKSWIAPPKSKSRHRLTKTDHTLPYIPDNFAREVSQPRDRYGSSEARPL
jgi:hypothetical protein